MTVRPSATRCEGRGREGEQVGQGPKLHICIMGRSPDRNPAQASPVRRPPFCSVMVQLFLRGYEGETRCIAAASIQDLVSQVEGITGTSC